MKSIALENRVYLEDTDAQGVVYNASYFRFFERARTEWLRDRFVKHNTIKNDYGISLVLSKIEVKFVSPARLDDLIIITADIKNISGAKITFSQSIYKDLLNGQLLSSGIAEVAFIDTITSRPVRIPQTLMDELRK